MPGYMTFNEPGAQKEQQSAAVSALRGHPCSSSQYPGFRKEPANIPPCGGPQENEKGWAGDWVATLLLLDATGWGPGVADGARASRAIPNTAESSLKQQT